MSSDNMPSFGALIRRWREAAGLSQEELARRAGVTAQAIGALERGDRQRPYPSTVRRLADALDLSADARATLLARLPGHGRALPNAATQGQSLPSQPGQSQARDAQTGDSPARIPAHQDRPSLDQWMKPTSPATPLEVAMGTPAPLVGRVRELDLLERFLGEMDSPTTGARLLLLAGEPGIGKSHLLRVAAERAIAMGWTVLVGGCHRSGGQEPYAPLLDALAHYLQMLNPLSLRAALNSAAWLVRLLPELADVLDPLPIGGLTPQQERRLMYAAVERVLTNLAGAAGTLLVLDDLQWAGPDALDLLASLVRTRAPVRVVGAYRDTEVRPADPLGILLADLAQARLVRQEALSALDQQDAATLLDNLLIGTDSVDRSTAEAVLWRAGGVPFFLVSYVQAVVAGVTEAVPWDVAQGVRQRLALLPEQARQVIGAAAVIGRRVPWSLVRAVMGQSEEAVLIGLEAACQGRLLLEQGDNTYVFAHDVIREVVEADMGVTRRALLHHRVAEVLAGDPGDVPPELLADHFTRGGDWENALRYRELAGDHAWAERAYAAAEAHYRVVLNRLDSLGRSQEALGVRKKLGEVLFQTGHYAAAITVLQDAAAGLRDGDPEHLEHLGWMAARLGAAHALNGTQNEGLAIVQPLLDRLDHGSDYDGGHKVASPVLAALYWTEGRLLLTSSRYDKALISCERAVACARASGDAGVLARAREGRANILQLLGRLTEARQAYEEVIPLASAVGDVPCQVDALRDLALLQAMLGAFAVGRQLSERSSTLARQIGDPGLLASTLTAHGWLTFLPGDTARGRAVLDEAMQLSQRADRSWYSVYPLIISAHLSLTMGDEERSRTLIDQALALVSRSNDLQALRWAAWMKGELDVLAGCAAAARDLLVPLLDRPGLEECNVTMFLAVLAHAYLDLGQVNLAIETVEKALVRTRREQMWLVLVDALRVQTLIALHEGRREDAARSLEEGLDLARTMSYPFAEARLLHVKAASLTPCPPLHCGGRGGTVPDVRLKSS